MAGTPAAQSACDALFRWGERTYVMGIVNVTPDSFSGDGIVADREAALRYAESAAAAGADLLDIGGESTRPGARPVPLEEELRRVLPVVDLVCRRTSLPVSIDTYKAEVAERALDLGARIVNDVWALRRDQRMAKVVADRGAYVVLMHNRQAVPEIGELGGYYPTATYDDVVDAVARDLQVSVDLALQAGVRPDRIIVDPGFGFGKSPEHSRELLRRLPELRQRLPYPLLAGPSRKSFVGLVTGARPAERLPETLAAVALCVAGGADIVRVHDVGPGVRACRVADAVIRPRAARHSE